MASEWATRRRVSARYHWSWRWASRLTGRYDKVRTPPDVSAKTKPSDAAAQSIDRMAALPGATFSVHTLNYKQKPFVHLALQHEVFEEHADPFGVHAPAEQKPFVHLALQHEAFEEQNWPFCVQANTTSCSGPPSGWLSKPPHPLI
jgi:hypothetical protein